jgi:hypothetical protein
MRLAMDATELAAFQQFKQIVVWGFPLHTHTHSYIHGAWVKTFKHLGLTTHWFHDGEHPSPATFDYSNTLFITEGWADDHIPVHATSTYFVHIAKNPAKYLDAGARLIEIRYNVLEIHDYNYDYTLPTDAFALSRDTLYEVVKDDRAVAGRRGRAVKAAPYEAVYMYWATDLLPHEFNYEDAAATEKLPVVFYVGSIDGDTHPFHTFRQACEKTGEISVVQIDPWRTPISYEENIALMKASYCAPDFRTMGSVEKAREYGRMNGNNQLEIGYIPCRVLKAISYGQTGITNSPRVKAILGEHVEYVADPAAVLEVAERRKGDVVWRQTAMRHVAERHTFLQRARDLARALMMRNRIPIVVSAAKANYAQIEHFLQNIHEPVILSLENSQFEMWSNKFQEVCFKIDVPICIVKVTSVNKFELIEEVAQRLLTEHVVWMDIGFSVFFEKPFVLRKKLLDVLGKKMSVETNQSVLFEELMVVPLWMIPILKLNTLTHLIERSPEFFDIVPTNQVLGGHRTMFFHWFSTVD